MEKITLPMNREQWKQADKILSYLAKAYTIAEGGRLSMSLVSDKAKEQYFILVNSESGGEEIQLTTPETMEDILLEGMAVIENLTDKSFSVM